MFLSDRYKLLCNIQADNSIRQKSIRVGLYKSCKTYITWIGKSNRILIKKYVMQVYRQIDYTHMT